MTVMTHNPSVIRARFILTLLRMAREAEAQDAKRLLKSAASEYPLPDTPDHLAPYERAAIDAVDAISKALSSDEKAKPVLWENANVAATNWLEAAK